LEKAEHFWEYEIRPRFKLNTPYSLQEIIDRISNGIHRPDAPCKARIVHDQIVLFFPSEEQHYWSPQLSLSIEEEEDGSLIRGFYGPRPAVWTMFVFFYSSIAFGILFIIIFGLSYISLGKSPDILWLVPLLLIIFLSLYRVSYQGQKMGADEMETLHRFLESCIRY
jgi:hypothetical protein